MTSVVHLALRAAVQVERVTPLFLLALRLHVANVFWKAGWVKLQSWDSTIALFENEYQVPVLSPGVAALLGTGGELVLPVLLGLGLGSRFAALGLFVINVVAVISYPDIEALGLKDHILWGWLLAVVFFVGAGKLSLDAWLQHRWGRTAAA